MKKIHLTTTSSTNDYLKENLNNIKYQKITCTADYQTSGRGRISHTWESKEKQNIIVSYLYKNIKANNVSLITLSIAVAVRKFLLNYLDNISIKWPNDIYYKDKKICGILCENIITNSNNIIIGIGINVNQTNYGDLDYKVSSLKQITNQDYDIDKLINKLTRYVNYEVNKFLHHHNHLYIVEYINQCLYGKNKLVEYTYCNQKQQGTVYQLDATNNYLGAILIKTNNDLIRIISDEIIFVEK